MHRGWDSFAKLFFIFTTLLTDLPHVKSNSISACGLTFSRVQIPQATTTTVTWQKAESACKKQNAKVLCNFVSTKQECDKCHLVSPRRSSHFEWSMVPFSNRTNSLLRQLSGVLNSSALANNVDPLNGCWAYSNHSDRSMIFDGVSSGSVYTVCVSGNASSSSNSHGDCPIPSKKPDESNELSASTIIVVTINCFVVSLVVCVWSIKYMQTRNSSKEDEDENPNGTKLITKPSHSSSSGDSSKKEKADGRRDRVPSSSISTRIVHCKCGTELIKISSRSAYQNSQGIKCNKCETKVFDTAFVYYHCPRKGIPEHPRGYDLCMKCVPQSPSIKPVEQPPIMLRPLTETVATKQTYDNLRVSKTLNQTYDDLPSRNFLLSISRVEKRHTLTDFSTRKRLSSVIAFTDAHRLGTVTETHDSNMYDMLSRQFSATDVSRMTYAMLPRSDLGSLLDPRTSFRGRERGASTIAEEAMKLDVEKVTVGPKIGSGAFADVFIGVYEHAWVAIKMLRDDDDDTFDEESNTSEYAMLEQKDMSMDMDREMKLFSKLRRKKHVAQIYGYCENPWCVVMEYYPNLDVRKLVYGKNPVLLAERFNDSIENISVGRRIQWCFEAAIGLRCLHETKPAAIIHRDIAARNLLLDDNLKCHVADFGMSRLMKHDNQTTVSHEGPLKWMAPESIRHRDAETGEHVTVLWNKKTDIYMFGITMWEIFHGREPYTHLHPYEAALGVIHEDIRPEIDTNSSRVPVEVAELIEECWAIQPNDRPRDFGEIQDRLGEMRKKHMGKQEFQKMHQMFRSQEEFSVLAGRRAQPKAGAMSVVPEEPTRFSTTLSRGFSGESVSHSGYEELKDDEINFG